MSPDPKRAFAIDVVRKLQDAGFRALWAGGCVRDFLLKIEPKDYDVATDAVPNQVREIFGRRNTHAVGVSFGVILVIGPKDAGNVEVATFRTDGSYADGRRPDSVEFSTPEEDARRRDFTINGMFYDPLAKQVHDFVGGEADLSAGIIRAIGDPHDRVREDKLRLLRAVRFAATLEFELDPVTADAVREMADQIHVVSVERILQELRRMLVDVHRRRAMELCREVGLLHEMLPELKPILGDTPHDEPLPEWDVTLHMLRLLQEPGFELAAAAILHAVAAPQGTGDDAVATTAGDICRRLRMSNAEQDHVEWLLSHRHALDDAPQARPSRLKRLMVHTLFDDLLSLVHAERIARNVDLGPVVFCEEFLRNTPEEELNPPELLTGDDLIRMGFTPGPQFKEWLTAVRDAQLDGEIATKDEAVAFVRRLRTKGRT